ncbi:alpha/beta hydrolase [uncultured Sunxiuqinia sp.]|uniref:alpha/beta hydrolase n=1 Tax=uncultured Sunxiuqinia sp. TaxID=1573825 RepID=UPI002AA71E8B|nr:alpha/beta hydrolase [uncultured Sunxiuqinia sp.]
MKQMQSIVLFIFLCAASPLYSQIVTIDGIPKDTAYTPYSAWVKIKKDYPNVTRVYPDLPDGVKAENNIVYVTLPDTPYGKRDLHMDVFRPGKCEEYPALVMVFGGGWRTGSKEAQVPMAQKIAAQGYVTAAIEYRLSPEALYPAAVYDIKAAIRFLRANADKYGIDPNRIAITGSSAGGQLAALVGFTGNMEEFEGDLGNNEVSSNVQAIIDMDGILDFTTPSESLGDNTPGKHSAGYYWFGATLKEARDKWVEASPMIYAGKDSPPILFINSTQPRFHAGRDSVISVLNTFDIYSEVHTIPNSVHSFWQVHPWFEETVDYMVSFLDRVFKNEEK